MIIYHSMLHILKFQNFITHIQWISSHKDIIENKKADIVTQKKMQNRRLKSVLKDLFLLATWRSHKD